MKLVSFYIVIILSIIISSCSKNNNKCIVSYDETAVYERDSAIVVACRMMSNDSTEEALYILDSLGVAHPNYPLIPFLHGFAHQISGDSCKATPQYWKSIQMYDSMMGGLPVVLAFTAPDTPVRQFECGFQCDPEDQASVVEAIRNIKAMSEEDRNKMGENGREAILDKFTYKKLAEQFIDSIYK